jgi:hypothetical protein
MSQLDDIIEYIDPQHQADHWRHKNGKQQLKEYFTALVAAHGKDQLTVKKIKQVIAKL